MSFSMSVNRGGKPGLATALSAKPLLFGKSAVDYGWMLHVAGMGYIAYQAFNGNNVLETIGVNAPLYKVAVVAIAEGARAIFSLANVWEDEINYVASTVLVAVLLSMGGADVTKLPNELASQVKYQVAKTSNSPLIGETWQGCTLYNPVINRELTLAERHQCIELKNSNQMTKTWAKNCGCSTTSQQVKFAQ